MKKLTQSVAASLSRRLKHLKPAATRRSTSRSPNRTLSPSGNVNLGNTALDTGGQNKFRLLRQHCYLGTKDLIYVVTTMFES